MIFTFLCLEWNGMVCKRKIRKKTKHFFFSFFFTLGPISETEGFIQSTIWFDIGNSSVQ